MTWWGDSYRRYNRACRKCWEPIGPKRIKLNPDEELCMQCAKEPRMWPHKWFHLLWLSWFGSVKDRSICDAAPSFPRWADPHDYPVHRGGDGHPTHEYTYKCHECGREFTI